MNLILLGHFIYEMSFTFSLFPVSVCKETCFWMIREFSSSYTADGLYSGMTLIHILTNVLSSSEYYSAKGQ